MPVTASRSTAVTLPEGPFPQVAVDAELRFDASLPYAVCLAFPPLDDGGEVQWVFARELLNEGRHTPVGHGDVAVAPGRDGQVLVTLRSPAGRAVISIPSDAVAAFLYDSYAVVPAGTESAHLDLDSALARLLP
ncbi:SsgA family sporulation/cell division regulator [Streptomyces sp. NRRL S-350]|uniref:SsgA family sporulation/cell division regulator n=1 Tax=Streptomyces sp. NRRL S-350 TaxID=1463902 RepID=UPI0004C27D12|nr:SsgA family sporulation/cell division regulator [Streptomyces sp. NRRL S-350]